jgi:ABC-2 type transport system permease protein
MIAVSERVASTGTITEAIASNSTQHNIPAWTVFAMFFIVIPLSSNMVRERMSGTFARLSTMSASISNYYSGKLISYTLVCLAQATIIVIVGLFALPFIGLAKLDLGSGIFPLILASVTVGAAATSFGLLVGSIFRTHQQAAIFGVVTVVIMAALGGIWVPIYAMPESMRNIGELSPLYWALECFNMVFLRGLDPIDILFGTIELWSFSFICILFTLMKGRRMR